jgi:F420-dependent oxidoreductase-like protein
VLSFAVMIEGQEGLTWARWRRIAQAAEDLGYDALFRSDHLTGLSGDAKKPSLDAWTSITWLATATRRIRFGPLVSPLTFHHPALLAKRAAAVAELSGGRLDLGIGAGWHEGEHRMFGIPFPPLRERLDRLDEGARVIRALWEGRPVTLPQRHYPLVAAESYPLPPGNHVPLVIGGRGEKRTLRIVARDADEWNVTRVSFDDYVAKCRVLEEHCRAVGRDPAAIRRSLMVLTIVGRTAGERAERIARARAVFPQLPAEEAAWRAAGFLAGPMDAVIDDLKQWQKLGMNRVMLQMLDQEDVAALELFAREVAPEFSR